MRIDDNNMNLTVSDSEEAETMQTIKQCRPFSTEVKPVLSTSLVVAGRIATRSQLEKNVESEEVCLFAFLF